VPSSKKDRGSVAACVGACAGLVNDVVEDPMTGIVVPIDKFGLEKGSALDRVAGDMPLLIESIEVAGETPSETCDRRFRGCFSLSIFRYP